MKNQVKKMVIIILLIMNISIPVFAESISSDTWDTKMSQLRQEFPDYSTWTDSFDGGSQCWGFARLIAYRVFGEHASDWGKSTDINAVKRGDVVQYGNTSGSGHTIFVTGVSGNTITFVDCNGNGNYSDGTKVRSCGIKWDNTISKGSAMFGKYSFSYLLSSPDSTGHNDTENPTISNIEISNISSSGYDVSCIVTDNVGVDRVQFPTWTLEDGQDDIFADWSHNSSASGTKNGDRYTYHVDVSAHNYEGGTYRTHIYAFDISGNYSIAAAPDVEVDRIEPIIADILVSEVSCNGYTVSCTVTDDSGIDRVQFPTWTVKDGQDDLIEDWSHDQSVRGTGEGDVYTYRVDVSSHNYEEGIYRTHIYAYDKYGNCAGAPLSDVELDRTEPMIADITISDISSSGYTVSCTVTDDSGIDRVQFPTWTVKDGQDDLIEDWSHDQSVRGTGEGDVYTYRVDVSAHNNEGGSYRTHIYAYDNFGNCGGAPVQDVDVPVDSAVVSEGVCGENLIWSLDKKGVFTILGSGDMTDYTSIKTVPWYEYASQITSVVVEEGVTSIGDYALYGLKNMTSVSIPEGVTKIGDYAFKNSSSLAEIALPSTLKKLGESAFYGCSGLTGIAIPEGVYTVWAYTFKNCTSLAEVTLPSTLIKIDEAAFYGCSSLKKLNIPDSVSIIGIYCFKNCTSLTDVSLPAELTQIREAAFYGTGLTSLEVPEGVTRIDAYAFKNAVSLARLALPESLTKIGEAAFYSSTISELTIPDAVESIGSYAFKNCTSLHHVQLPANLTQISESSFYGCTKLDSLVIPDHVTSIGNYAFRKCSGLKSVDFSTGLTSIGESSFYGCESLTGIVVPEGVTTIKGYAFKGCTGLTDAALPNSLTEIGESALYGCTGLTEITIPQNVSVIGNYTFANSTSLGKVRFVGNAPSIGEKAFSKVNVQAFYPANNTSWTSEVMQNYGGTITWVEEGDNQETVDEDVVAMIDSGECGTDITWVLKEDGSIRLEQGKLHRSICL